MKDLSEKTWFAHEDLKFRTRLTRISVQLSDFWNGLDYAMIILSMVIIF